MDDNINKVITCPITLDIFKEPIMLTDELTYEKLAVFNNKIDFNLNDEYFIKK
jgi:hypothetical protein